MSTKENSIGHSGSGRGSSIKRSLLEALLIAVIGALLALAANALSPRGLSLTRNYFPGAVPVSVSSNGSVAQGSGVSGGSNAVSNSDVVTARLHAKGLQIVRSNQVVELFRDPRYAQQAVVFVDARDDAHYQAGHIPGAYQFDHYRPEQHLATVLPAAMTAEQIVVYCGGQDCEDSEFAAVQLRDAGVSGQKLFVYPGGFAEWSTNRLPVETGARNSGNLRNPDR